jgi:hypothetical protein
MPQDTTAPLVTGVRIIDTPLYYRECNACPGDMGTVTHEMGEHAADLSAHRHCHPGAKSRSLNVPRMYYTLECLHCSKAPCTPREPARYARALLAHEDVHRAEKAHGRARRSGKADCQQTADELTAAYEEDDGAWPRYKLPRRL